jgi:hypothetical protein
MSNSTLQLGSTATQNAKEALDREFLQRIEAGQFGSVRRRPRPAVSATSSDATALHEEPDELTRARAEGSATRRRRHEAIFDQAHKRANLYWITHRTTLRRELRRVDRGMRRLGLRPAHSAPRTTGCSAGRREARPGRRRSAASSRTAARSRGGGESGSGPGDSEPPDAAAFDDDEAVAGSAGGGSGDGGSGSGGGGGLGSGPPEGDGEFSYEEAADIAAHVAQLFPASLTTGLFDAAVWPWVWDMDADGRCDAKEKIYSQLPDRLRMSILSDALVLQAVRIEAGEVPVGAGLRCRCCGGPYEPLEYVDTDEICELCWDLPGPLRDTGDMLEIGPGTFAPPDALDCTHIDRRLHGSDGGAS